MANQKHIEWLLEGVERWNKRREEENFAPALEGVNIYGEFEKAGKLKTGIVPLSGIDLRRSNLRKARFSPIYTSAGGADLSDANLKWANLEGTQFGSSRLHGAILLGARLKGATLGKADLTGVDLSCSEPWKADLFEKPKTPGHIQPAFPSKHITAISDLIKNCSDLLPDSIDNVLYFRGENNKTWKLQPSVMRRSRNNRTTLRCSESDMLMELMSQRPEDFNNTTSALAEWVLAQHHGLTTRLLDVSRNPLVALFCACETSRTPGRVHVFSLPRELVKPFNSDTISIITNFAKLFRAEQDLVMGRKASDKKRKRNTRRPGTYEHAMGHLYHLIRQEKPYFKEEIDPRVLFQVFAVEPQQSFERIRAQSGAFLISAFHEQFERDRVLKQTAGIPIYDHTTFEVLKENKQQILQELRQLNISRDTLFPGLEDAAKAVAQRHSKRQPTRSAAK